MGGAPGAAGAEAPPPEAEKSPEEEEKQANALIAELTGLKKAA
jgi:hypothetical protein